MATDARRLRIKPEHRPVQVSGDRVRIGGAAYGIAAEVEDRSGAVWTLLSAMDGTRSPDEVVAHVVATHPGERAETVHRAMQRFVDAGHVEDVAAADPPVLTARDRQRHDRARAFYRWIDPTPRTSSWEPQVRLRTARVCVVGLGGTGGHVALALAAGGVGELHCVDSDVVELSNLNRQVLYVEDDIGQPKAEAAVRRLRRLNSDIHITGARLTIRGEADLTPLAERCDVLMLCADQPGEIRAWANRACLATGTPWVDAGYHGPVATATAYVPGHGACYECVWWAEHERHVAMGVEADYTLRRGGSNAVTAPTAGLSGYLAAHLGISLLTGLVPVRSGLVQGINVVAPDHHFLIETAQRPGCPACGGRS